jgi:hypothetical protein
LEVLVLVTYNNFLIWPFRQVTFSTIDKPKLLSEVNLFTLGIFSNSWMPMGCHGFSLKFKEKENNNKSRIHVELLLPLRNTDQIKESDFRTHFLELKSTKNKRQVPSHLELGLQLLVLVPMAMGMTSSTITDSPLA